MNVWIVNPFDNLPQEGTRPQRYWLLARAFVRAGHQVTLWTSDFSHARKARRAIDRAEFSEEGVRVVMVPTPPYSKNICLRRIRSHRILAKRWIARARQESRPDVVISSVPPLGLAAGVADYCKDHGVCFIADIQDAWPETFERVVPRWMLTPLRRTARKIYGAADAIGGVARCYLDLARAYGATCPMVEFPLSIETDPCGEEGRSPLSEPPSIALVYAGNMGKSYDLATVLEAVKTDPSLRLDLAGSGPDETVLRERAMGCDRIVFHGYLGESALRKLLARADVGLIPMFDDSCVGIPGKLADYLAAGLPVLNSLSGETAELIQKAGAGFTYAAGRVSALQDALDSFRQADREQLRAAARNLFKSFDARIVMAEYVSWIENVCAKYADKML